jgi:NAD(P)-dependent dehydrogenase (short-subunit alcohol dehydrogenase family)
MRGSAEELIRLDGRHAVITGGARGIGRAIAERFVHVGASVLLADKREEVDDVAAELRADGFDATAAVMDVTDPARVQDLVDQSIAAKGRLDIWVNDAGIYPVDLALEISDEAWLRVLDVNTNGTSTVAVPPAVTW